MLMFLFACSTNTKMAEYSNCTTFCYYLLEVKEATSLTLGTISISLLWTHNVPKLFFYSPTQLCLIYQNQDLNLKTAQKKLINNVLENVKKKEKQTNKNNFPFIASRSRCWIIWSIMSVFYQELLITAGLLTTIPFRFPNLKGIWTPLHTHC